MSDRRRQLAAALRRQALANLQTRPVGPIRRLLTRLTADWTDRERRHAAYLNGPPELRAAYLDGFADGLTAGRLLP